MTDQEKLVREIFGLEEKPQRTKKQNRSLHLACTLLSNYLNDSGLEMNKVLVVDIPWSPETVKQWLYKPVMKAHTHKDSTTELNRKDISDVWEILMKNLAEKKGVEYIEFPSEDKTEAYLNGLKQADSLNTHKNGDLKSG